MVSIFFQHMVKGFILKEIEHRLFSWSFLPQAMELSQRHKKQLGMEEKDGQYDSDELLKSPMKSDSNHEI